jgi:hypothetical protein
MSGPNVDNLLECLAWIKARHEVWEKRQCGLPGPWTDHPIVSSRKFTNVFRILDPGTQFVLKDLVTDNPGPEEFLARIILYRNTNLPEPWYVYRGELSITENTESFRRHLHSYKAQHGGVFSGAYMVWGGTEKGVDKIDHVIGWLIELMDKGVLTDFFLADSQKERFDILKECRGIGGFIAMQCLTDFGYGDFDKRDNENDFVVCGPGALKGANWLWPGKDPDYVVRWLQETVWSDPDCPTLELRNGVDRKPSLMDIQNCLCETSKLARYLEKPPGRPYVPAHPGVQRKPQFPLYWYTSPSV